MQRESEHSGPRAPWLPSGSGGANPESDAQQEAIIREEERSTDALERAGNAPFPAANACSDDYAALLERGRQLAATLAELVVSTREVRAAARSARLHAMLARNRHRLLSDP